MPHHQPASIAVLLHLSNTHNWPDFDAALKRLEQPFDLFINLVEGLNSRDELDQQSALIQHRYPHARFVRSSNRGMDIGGMFRLFEQVHTGTYQAVFYAHSKSNDAWRHKLLEMLTHNSTGLISLFTEHHKMASPIGMIGAYSYPFDYYNLGPYLEILKQLGIKLDSSWSRYYSRYPAMREVPIEQRISHARECADPGLRPELDIEYARAMLGNSDIKEQTMNPEMLRRFIADKVLATQPYFPGNFFWISMPLIHKLRTLINFEQERAQLPMSLSSDHNLQSRAHAWERALPVFVEKSGYRLYSLQSRTLP